MLINFCKAARSGDEEKFIQEAIESGQLGGDGGFTKKCSSWFLNYSNTHSALLTPSCTHALEMTAFLMDIKSGDEIIMPSYTFVSTANAFVLRGAKIVFVDIKPNDLNIDETKIEAAITKKTKAIVPVHYAGAPCEMDAIMSLAEKHNLYVVEDAAQGLMSTYKGKPLGTIGHFGALSFHTTKNFTSGGEGGLLYVNDTKFTHRAEIFREKGTNRSSFFRGEIDKYTWRDMGSSMLPSELQMAYLWAQLKNIDRLHSSRMEIWDTYFDALQNLNFKTSTRPDDKSNQHNGHIFYVMGAEINRRYLPEFKKAGIHATSHYEPLHASEMGQQYGRVVGSMENTDYLSSHIIRLPIYEAMTSEQISRVIETTKLVLSGSGTHQ